MKTFINKTKHVSVLEGILRTLLDMPTYNIKDKLIGVMTLLDNHTMVFSMRLGNMMNKIFALRNMLEPKDTNFGMTDETIDEDHSANETASLARQELSFLMSLQQLVNKICTN
jgi:hypothetical protein